MHVKGIEAQAFLCSDWCNIFWSYTMTTRQKLEKNWEIAAVIFEERQYWLWKLRSRNRMYIHAYISAVDCC